MNGKSLSERLLELDTATVYEASGQKNMVDPAIRPSWPGARLCGVAMTVDSPPADNLTLHHAIANAAPGVIIVAAAGKYLRAGAWGEIMTVAAQARGIAGLAIDGAVRDVEAISARKFPIFSRGLCIGACSKERFGKINVPIIFGGVLVRPGDLILADCDGIVVVEQERAEEVYQASVARRDREKAVMEELVKGRTTIDVLKLKAAAGA